MAITILDGAMGTELERRGVDTSGTAWSARAVIERPEVVREIHREYSAAGAMVHTACTFRATRRGMAGLEGTLAPWEEVARRAVALAREGAGAGARIAGSIAPLADCWHPELSPANEDPEGAKREHAALAQVLADAGCDLLLCETFSHVGEGLIALEAGMETGLETWMAWTPGYGGDLLGPGALGDAARAAEAAGAAAVLVNCAPARRVEGIVSAMRAWVGAETPIGAYANAGAGHEGLGAVVKPSEYAELARRWIELGVTIVGGCCHATPAHISAVAALA